MIDPAFVFWFKCDHQRADQPPKKEEPKKEEKPKAEEKPKEPEPELPPEKKQALQEKELGNEAYKKKDFETAIAHYKKAFELDPDNMTFLTNLAGINPISFLASPSFKID